MPRNLVRKGAVALLALTMSLGALGLSSAVSIGPASAQSGPPSQEPATDLRSDKLSGPYLDDSRPGFGVGFPMAIAGVAIFGVVMVLVVRSRRSSQERSPRQEQPG